MWWPKTFRRSASGRHRDGAALVAVLSTLFLGVGGAAADDDADALGPPPLYEELREARPEAVGRIRGGSLQIDRFSFELTDGDLYVVRMGEGIPIAIYLGRGTVRAWPPNGVEHQQLRKLIDEDFLEEEFERLVFWTTGDLGQRLAGLAAGPPGRRAGRAADLLEDRREELLERQLANPDSRVLMALWRAEAEPPLGASPRAPTSTPTSMAASTTGSRSRSSRATPRRCSSPASAADTSGPRSG